MNTKYKILAIGGVLGLVAIIIGATILFKGSGTDNPTGVDLSNQAVSADDPVDIVLDFYGSWLEAAQSTSTDPYQAGVIAEPVLSEALRTKLEAGRNREATQPDPVLCHATVPLTVKAKVVFEVEGEAQILVKIDDATTEAQSIATLLRHNNGWYINDIVCSYGDAAPEREFSFDNEGFILKGVPPQLNPEYWYIVFEEDGKPGHHVPLSFNGESMCKSPSGEETVCSPDQFLPVSKAHVYGQLGESGAEVKRIEFME
jgi:hypothetical protein